MGPGDKNPRISTCYSTQGLKYIFSNLHISFSINGTKLKNSLNEHWQFGSTAQSLLLYAAAASLRVLPGGHVNKASPNFQNFKDASEIWIFYVKFSNFKFALYYIKHWVGHADHWCITSGLVFLIRIQDEHFLKSKHHLYR